MDPNRPLTSQLGEHRYLSAEVADVLATAAACRTSDAIERIAVALEGIWLATDKTGAAHLALLR